MLGVTWQNGTVISIKLQKALILCSQAACTYVNNT